MFRSLFGFVLILVLFLSAEGNASQPINGPGGISLSEVRTSDLDWFSIKRFMFNRHGVLERVQFNGERLRATKLKLKQDP